MKSRHAATGFLKRLAPYVVRYGTIGEFAGESMNGTAAQVTRTDLPMTGYSTGRRYRSGTCDVA